MMNLTIQHLRPRRFPGVNYPVQIETCKELSKICQNFFKNWWQWYGACTVNDFREESEI